jgi:hypothetical protein
MAPQNEFVPTTTGIGPQFIVTLVFLPRSLGAQSGFGEVGSVQHPGPRDDL